MAKKIVFTDQAPEPIGPYSQAVWAGDMLYISGQIAINPETGELIIDNIDEEATQVMENLKSILAEAGLNFSNVVKSSIFLYSMDDFNKVNEIYSGYFNNVSAPARETVEVSALPKGVNVEISMIAYKG